jgi:hypothetical protein
MFKFEITMANGQTREIEATQWVDAGHEGRWIDFKVRSAGDWYPVLRLLTSDVRKIERKD